MRILAWVFDERFLVHRLRATSIAGLCGGVVAMVLFAWHYYADHVWTWELLSVGLTMAAVKWAVMLWYRFTN
jgi:hypothetical protein